ncbi:DUF3048 domain-containing protein [Candidatus Dojkabacteria bacterium]|nr:DUF3048 domain-containing protein [Candidatus Dojkabacteria bacterium]
MQKYSYKKKEVDTQDVSNSNKDVDKKRHIFRIASYFCIGILGIGTGFLANSLYWKYVVLKDKEKVKGIQHSIEQILAEDEEEQELINLDDGPIRSPLNGIELTDAKYEKISQHIPHAVMISNNQSARVEQYGLNSADIVYEAETEGGITRFMAIYWSNQEGYIIKPIRSVRKYFFDWAIEYGNIPVTFTGFADTDNYNTDAWGFYIEQKIRVTYFDWPFLWDDACISQHPRMHCKRTAPELLYQVFDKYGWSFESWEGFVNKSEWSFDKNLPGNAEYIDTTEFSYDFTWPNEWSSRWTYNQQKNLYEKHDPDEAHIDMQDNEVITASTVIIQKTKRTYTYDEEQRVEYETVGSGEAYIIRDGKRIEGVWEKKCHKCRTRFFHVKHPSGNSINIEIPLKPGKIWIAVVPQDKEIQWIN